MEKLTGLKKTRTAVFISGSGSNLKNIIKFSKIKKSPISIDLTVSNTSKANGLQYADHFNIKKKYLVLKILKMRKKKYYYYLKKKK
jgi:phosphoribosylglycinamide formyltransferase-1